MRPDQVRFSQCPRPFQVAMTRCANPECECTEVAFGLQEVMEVDEPNEDAIVFTIRLDGETWEEVDPPPRTPEIARLVQEFLRDYPPSEREAIQRIGREKKRIVRSLQEYRIDPELMASGELLAFGEITHDRSSGRFITHSFFCGFEHDGVDYYVDDLYYPNPECDCREVYLAFLRCAPSPKPDGGIVAEHDFLVKLTLDGRATIVDRECRNIVEAKSVLAAWQLRFGDDIDLLRWRYRKIKEIARRSRSRYDDVIRRADIVAREPSPVGLRVGRNDPCPCGSGKKYKRCCAKGSDAVSRLR